MLNLPADVFKNCIIPHFDSQTLESFHTVCKKLKFVSAHALNRLTFQKLYGLIAPSESHIPILVLKDKIVKLLSGAVDNQILCFNEEDIPFYIPLTFKNWEEKVNFYKGEHFLKIYSQVTLIFKKMDDLYCEIKAMPCKNLNVGQHLRDQRQRLRVINKIRDAYNVKIKDTLQVYKAFEESLSFFERNTLKMYTRPVLSQHFPRLNNYFKPSVGPIRLNIIKIHHSPCEINYYFDPHPHIESTLRLESPNCLGIFSISRATDGWYPNDSSFLKVPYLNVEVGYYQIKLFLLQLAIEIFLREKDRVLQIGGKKDDPYFFHLAGLSFVGKADFPLKLDMEKAKERGGLFPPFKDFGSSFFKLYKKEGKLINDEGEEAKFCFNRYLKPVSWTTQIEESPLLKGSGPLLPIFYNE